MPGYKKHLAGGTVAYAITLYALRYLQPSMFTAAQWFLCSLAGSLFPDIDIKSKGQKLFYWLILMLLLVLLATKQFESIAILSIISVVPMLVKHRGLFHQLWFIIACPMVIAFFISLWLPLYTVLILWDALFFIVGAISHLWLDLGFKRMIRFK